MINYIIAQLFKKMKRVTESKFLLERQTGGKRIGRIDKRLGRIAKGKPLETIPPLKPPMQERRCNKE